MTLYGAMTLIIYGMTLRLSEKLSLYIEVVGWYVSCVGGCGGWRHLRGLGLGQVERLELGFRPVSIGNLLSEQVGKTTGGGVDQPKERSIPRRD